MALFNKQTDGTVKDDSKPKPSALPEAERTPATQAAAPAPSAPTEKPATSMRPASPETRSNSENRTYLDSGSKISGKLWFEGATRIDGQVDGEITSKESLVIGESAVVTAQIRAKSIIVAGNASGEIIANQRLEIRPSARITGNVTSPVLIVHEGALLEGRCTTMRPEGTREDAGGAISQASSRQT